jgi:IS5 family transposase
MKQLAIQSLLRPALTPVHNCKDHAVFQQTLNNIDQFLADSELESQAIEMALEGWEHAGSKQQQKRAQYGMRALRMEVLRFLLGGISFRQLSMLLGSSDLMADFCRAREMDGIRGISKSTVERCSKFFTEAQVRQLHRTLCEVAGNADLAGWAGLQKPFEMGTCLIDGTCLEANIHFPTDWVLLKDVASTLLKAIKLIRHAGLRHRMPQGPESYARQMNRLCIRMTHSRRRAHSRKERKKVLREIKKLLRTVGGHALRHRDLLKQLWEQSGYSIKEAERIMARIETMAAQIPAVIRQAHERIIGERQVPNAQKILSVHEPDMHVIVRGKAGKDVEFGNTLFLCESAEGLLLDWKLYRDRAPSEHAQMKQSLERQNGFDLEQPIEAVGADRGFASKAAHRLLAGQDIYDAMAPRQVDTMIERMQEPRFVGLQRRRGGTEGRIGTLKNRWHAGRLRARGFDNRALAVGWSVLSHNLWKIARRLAQEAEQREAQAA